MHEQQIHVRNEQHHDQTLKNILDKHVYAKLRPYQLEGVEWLWSRYSKKLGSCLADDMGLGKTIQVLSYLVVIQQQSEAKKHLLVVPASLVGNWSAELKKFTPGLRPLIFHHSEPTFDVTKAPDLTNIDLVITTYGLARSLPFLQNTTWDTIILDEAQAIKNPNSQQTRAIKGLNGRIKLALTGTPIENSLLDLWSIFDFIAPGLLGSSTEFIQLLAETDDEKKKTKHATLKRLVSSYILRRVKSDKHIINDLPDKTELSAYCTLTKQQALLYQASVDELAALLKNDVDDMKRRGLILSYVMRLKQICNHPNQWLGHNQYKINESGKFIRLQELCDTIAQNKEKVLVFTQFREIMPMLSECLSSIFGRAGLELHGETPVKKRAALVAEFQKTDGPPFFILSLKAGGTGLTLTNASHVIHFDRWWNPAVENQATARAYRIGQKRNVLVHKFICRGTIEEKIDAMISHKQALSQAIMRSPRAMGISELSDAELLNIVSLDIKRAVDYEQARRYRCENFDQLTRSINRRKCPESVKNVGPTSLLYRHEL